MLAIDNNKKYIVYRYGTNKQIDIEYPNELEGSFEKFKRFHYARYGGSENAGTDINQIEFANGDFTYKIYEQVFNLINDDKLEIGITVENNKTHRQIRIRGLVKTRKGSLADLNNLDLIQLTDESFNH